MRSITGRKSYRVIGQMTGQHPETVRRYMQGSSPSVEFLSQFCAEFGVNANWLLTGRGVKRMEEAKDEALRTANPSELLKHVAGTLEDLAARIDRIEVYVQTLEARVRSTARSSEGVIEPETTRAGEFVCGGSGGAGDGRARARAVADALAQRPCEDAD